MSGLLARAHDYRFAGVGGGPAHAVRLFSVGVGAADDPQ